MTVLGGCAAIFKGTSENMTLSSMPDGAQIYMNGQYIGVTPMRIRLKSKGEYTFEYRKEGHQKQVVYLSNSVGAGWIILDVLFGLLPVIVDAATNAWYELDQNVVYASLLPDGGMSQTPAPARQPQSTPSDDAARSEGMQQAPPPERTGPTVDLTLKDGSTSTGKLIGEGDDWIILEIYIKSKGELHEIVFKKAEIERILDVLRDADVTNDYLK
ncbi:MAG: PEGA domain-containing protein [Bacteroidetes bacterium]|nr:PEGA domain-containing protein [Bacteroidota bacterium]